MNVITGAIRVKTGIIDVTINVILARDPLLWTGVLAFSNAISLRVEKFVIRIDRGAHWWKIGNHSHVEC